jgi:hypothetical protein
MRSADSPQSLIERCEAKYREITSQPAYDKHHAVLWKSLIESARQYPMKHIRQEPEPNAADFDIAAFVKAVRFLREDYENLDYRQTLIDNLQTIEEAKEDLLAVVTDLEEALNRQLAKVVQYSDYIQAAE